MGVGDSLGEKWGGMTFNGRFCDLFIDFMNLYISVLLGFGCSHSFLGTLRDSMVEGD